MEKKNHRFEEQKNTEWRKNRGAAKLSKQHCNKHRLDKGTATSSF